MLEDPEVEMIVIALPLWLHAPVAIEAMKAGKHVFTEKLMAHSVAECKEMCRVARRDQSAACRRSPAPLLRTLRQRQFPDPERRARRDSPHPGPLAPKQRDADGCTRQEQQPDLRPQDRPAPDLLDEHGKVVYRDSWKRIHNDLDKNIDYKKYDYQSLDELINWRLYNRTGAGLMAELGSHQLDACSIFLDKKHPSGCHRHRRHVLLHRWPRSRRPRLHSLRIPRQGGERPDRGHLFLHQHQFVRRIRRDGDGL